MSTPGWPAVRPSRHRGWLWSPVWTCGFATVVPAVHAAFKLRTKSALRWAVGMTFGQVVAWSLQPDDLQNTAAGQIGDWMLVVLAVIGTAYAYHVHDRVFAPQPVMARPVDPAMADALDERQLRAEAAQLAVSDPALARDLKIGRPDLGRTFDDGGLVDLNGVPPEVLVRDLGMKAEEALAVVRRREAVGRFVSLEELVLINEVTPDLLDRVRDRVVLL